MEGSDDEPAPDLVPISTPKIPVTIITGFLGTQRSADLHEPSLHSVSVRVNLHV